MIARFEGHIAQYLGDGLLVYFGYPLAHEDGAQRAVRAGLGIVEAMGPLNTRLTRERGVQVAVRLGIHTGLVVGDVGGGPRQEQLALGDTPNIAARLQGLATPDTVVISAATSRLMEGFFTCQALGPQALKGVPQPLMVYRVLHASAAQTRLDVATPRGLTPLVARDEEVALVQRRWDQATLGMGQVILLSGEAGLAQLRQGLATLLATGHEVARPLCLIQCGEAARHVGQGEEGLRLLAEALMAFEASERGDLLAEAYRLQGELLLCQADPEVGQALALARHQQARAYELRTALSLGRLWQRQGKRAEVYQPARAVLPLERPTLSGG